MRILLDDVPVPRKSDARRYSALTVLYHKAGTELVVMTCGPSTSAVLRLYCPANEAHPGTGPSLTIPAIVNA